MKRILYIAAMASLLMTSCQKTDVLNVAEDTIDFSTEVGKLTKATYTDGKFETLKAQGFRVWTFADFSIGTDTDGDIYRKMERLPVIFKPKEEGSTDGSFVIESDSKYFWPQDGNFLYFYTISAADTEWLGKLDHKTHFLPKLESGEVNRGEDTEITGLALPEFDVKEDANDDVMVADFIHQDKKDENGQSTKTVSPVFRHTMTKVMFNFAKGTPDTGDQAAEEANRVILKEIKTDLLCKAGNLTVTYSTESAPLTNKWTASSDTKDFTNFKAIGPVVFTMSKTGVEISNVVPTELTEGAVYFTESDDKKTRTIKEYCKKAEDSNELEWKVVAEHTQGNDATWTGDNSKYYTFNGWDLTSSQHTNLVTWYMIPQTLNNADGTTPANKTVTIQYVADGKHIEQDFSLVGGSVTEWVEELCVKYNVTIAPHKIQFSPTVSDWDQKGVDMAN